MGIEIRDPEGNILMDGEKLADWSDIPFIMKVFSNDDFGRKTRSSKTSLKLILKMAKSYP